MTDKANSMNHNAALHVLGDRGQTVDGSSNDVRGRQVKDKNGQGIEKVTDLLVDDRENQVRFLLVAHGGFLGFGDTKSLIPSTPSPRSPSSTSTSIRHQSRSRQLPATPRNSSMTTGSTTASTATTGACRTGTRGTSIPAASAPHRSLGL